MKSIFTTIAFSMVMAFCLGTSAFALAPVSETTSNTELSSITADQLINITPQQYTELTGKELSFTQVVKLKTAQTVLKGQKMFAKGGDGESKSQVIALILCILVGVLGIHRFYLGYTTIGIIQLLTAGGCGIWTLIDLIKIITGDLGPADGSAYNPTLKDM